MRESQPLLTQRRRGSVDLYMPRLSRWALGAAAADWTVPVRGPWPVNGEPVTITATNLLVRLAYGRILECYNMDTGHMSTLELWPNRNAARPGSNMLWSDGNSMVLVLNTALGRCAIVNTEGSSSVVRSIDIPPALYYSGGPDAKAVWDSQRGLLYALGPATQGGIVAYDTNTGNVVNRTDGQRHYSGIFRLPDGTLVATAPDQPRLTRLATDLALIGTQAIDVHVLGVL